MQQPFARSGLTAAQVTSLIRDAPAAVVGAGLELIDMAGGVLEDITDDLGGGTVGRAGYNTLHGTADLTISRDLDWGRAVVRPYMTLTDGVVTARFNLGAYLTSSPSRVAGASPVTHVVTGYDIIHVLNTQVGESYTVAAGTGYLAAVEAILVAQGIQSYQIDQDAAAKVLDAPRSWAMTDNKTWLNVVNELLAAVGYQGVWSDWDGRLQLRPYQTPTDRPAEWYYDTSDPTVSMLDVDRIANQDLFDAPNRWVFYWSADPAGDPPVEGAGIYTFVNELDGPTSVVARGGRVITAQAIQINVADQAALQSAARITIDADLRLKTTFDVRTHLNPLHWHFDRLWVHDPGLGLLGDVMVTEWSLPLNGDWMTQKWVLLQ